jgi:nucleotide-binding universal stress UspA family protein
MAAPAPTSVEGQLFFASVEDFMKAFDFKEAPEKVVIDVSRRPHLGYLQRSQALDMAVLKFRRDGAEVEIIGMNEASETIVDRLAIHDKPGAMDKLMGIEEDPDHDQHSFWLLLTGPPIRKASAIMPPVASRAFKPIDTAIVAYDGGASSQRVVDHIARNKLFSGLKIDLVTVGSRNRDTEKALENARAILTGAGLEVETTILSGQPDEVLGKRVEEHGAALVAMGAYGHSRIRAFVLGSTTSEMLRSCKAPVLLMR